MNASPVGAQPGTLMTGNPPRLLKLLPRYSPNPVAEIGLPAEAGIPPQVAQLPIAITASARGASRSTHAAVVIGVPSENFPSREKLPFPARDSFGIAPSSTRTNGEIVPSAARSRLARKASPLSIASSG